MIYKSFLGFFYHAVMALYYCGKPMENAVYDIWVGVQGKIINLT